MDHLPDQDAAPGNHVTVLVADHGERTRRGVMALLATCPDLHVVAEVGDGRTALEMVEKRRPMVALLELQLPEVDGIEAASRIKRRWPEVAVLLMAMHGAREDQAVRAGADGFLPKAGPPGNLISAIRKFGRRTCLPDRKGASS